MDGLSKFAMEYKGMPTLGFTHFQAAQLTTVGKRATLWLQSLLLDFEELEFREKTLRFRGVKGTTGTQASFEELFDGNFEKVKTLDEMVTEKAGFKKRFMVAGQTYDRKIDSEIMNLLSNIAQSAHKFTNDLRLLQHEKAGFKKRFMVAGQTYDRKIDSEIMNLLSNIAQSAHKFTNDLRLLQHLKEIEEPFEKNQIGSSAMAYKRNPMRSERISSLAKFVIALQQSTAMTASTQWFERTLDDSANKRLSLPQAFLAVDAILIIWKNILDGIVVYPKMIEKHIMAELPFMATDIIMEGVKNGGDRQELHEKIRVHSMEAGKMVKVHGLENDLIERIVNDPSFNIDKEKLKEILSPKNFIGFAEKQTEEFIEIEIKPILNKYSEFIGMNADLKV